MKKYFFTLGIFLTSFIIASEDSNDSILQQILPTSKNHNILPGQHNSPIISQNKNRKHYLKHFERAREFEDTKQLEDLRQLEDRRQVENLRKSQTSDRFENLASSLESLLQENISTQNHVIQMQSDALNKAVDQKFLERDQETKRDKNEFIGTLNVLHRKIENLENKVEQSRSRNNDSARILDDYSSQIMNLKRSFQRLEQGVFEKLSCIENNMYALTTSFLQILNQFEAIMKQQNRVIFVDSKDLFSPENNTAPSPVLKSLTDPEVKSSNASYGHATNDNEMPVVPLKRFVKRNSSDDFNDED